MSEQAHELTLRLLNAAPGAQRFYDVNLRADSYTPQLVREVAQLAHIVKLSEEELPCMSEIVGITASSLEKVCREFAHCFNLKAVCITRGPHGCALLLHDEFLEAPGFRVQVADTVGAGDAFSAALIHGIHAGWPMRQIAEFSNRIGALVASRPGGTPQWTMKEALALKPI
jgi:fructokinase